MGEACRSQSLHSSVKRRNGRGAKGGRKVGELQLVTRNTHRYQVTARPRPPENSTAISWINRVLRWNLTLATSVMGGKSRVLRHILGSSLTYIR